MIKRLFLGVILASITMAAGAQENPMKLQVQDRASHTGLPYAKIELIDSLATQLKTTSDKEGFFYIEAGLANKPGLTIKIEFLGYNSVKTAFSNKETIYYLEVSDKTIQQVVISGKRKLLSIANNKLVYDISKDSLNNRGNTANAMIQIPGLDISIKGEVTAGTKNILYMLNGQEDALVSSGKALSALPARFISKIELITEPDPIYKERGYDLIINILSKSDLIEGTLGSLTLAMDSRLGYTADGSFYFRKNSFSVNLSSQVNKTNSGASETTDIFNAGSYRNLTTISDIENNRYLNSIELNYLVNKTLFNAYGSYNLTNNTQDRNSVYTDIINRQTINGHFKQNFDNYMVGFGARFNQLSKKTNGSAGVSYSSAPALIQTTNNVPDADSLNIGISNTEKKELIIQGSFTTRFNTKYALDYGYQGIYRSYGSTNKTTYTQSDINHLLMADESSYTQNINALFLYAKFNPNQKLQLNMGMRVEYAGLSSNINTVDLFKTTYLNLLPRANMSYLVTKTQVFSFSYRANLKRPSIDYITPFVNTSNNILNTTGNPELKPEYFHSFNLGYTFYIGKYNIRPEFYYSFSNNSIQRIALSNNEGGLLQTYQNGGKTSYKVLYLGFGGAITKRINFNVNSGIGEGMVSFDNLKSDNLFYTISFTNSYNLGKGLRAYLSGFLNSPNLQAQGYTTGTNLYALGISKSFNNDKNILSISSSNFLLKNRNITNRIVDNGYQLTSRKAEQVRLINFSWFYKFGKLKETYITRGSRTSADDLKTN